MMMILDWLPSLSIRANATKGISEGFPYGRHRVVASLQFPSMPNVYVLHRLVSDLLKIHSIARNNIWPS